jgi:hypothetical protein
MGVRANFVIVDGQRLELYYDHWGAQGMSRDLVLDGAEATLARVRQMGSRDPSSPGHWLDDIWAEGMLVLDLPQRRLFWFDSDGMCPRLAAYLIERTWDGWKAVWSPGGTRGILHVLGIDPGPVLGDGAGAPSLARHELRKLDTRARRGPAALGTPFSDANTRLMILSVRFEDASVWPVTARMWLEDLSGWHWDSVVRQVARARAAGRRGGGKNGAWFIDSDCAQDGWAQYGAHVDVTARRLWWWSAHRPWTGDRYRSWTGSFHSFARNWPGFEITTLGDHYEWHERAAGISGIQPSLRDILSWEHEALTAAAGNPRAGNPVEAIVSDYTADPDVVAIHVSPGATDFVHAARVSGRRQALAELDALITAGADRLPPVWFVDPSGLVEPGDEP